MTMYITANSSKLCAHFKINRNITTLRRTHTYDADVMLYGNGTNPMAAQNYRTKISHKINDHLQLWHAFEKTTESLRGK